MGTAAPAAVDDALASPSRGCAPPSASTGLFSAAVVPLLSSTGRVESETSALTVSLASDIFERRNGMREVKAVCLARESQDSADGDSRRQRRWSCRAVRGLLSAKRCGMDAVMFIGMYAKTVEYNRAAQRAMHIAQCRHRDHASLYLFSQLLFVFLLDLPPKLTEIGARALGAKYQSRVFSHIPLLSYVTFVIAELVFSADTPHTCTPHTVSCIDIPLSRKSFYTPTSLDSAPGLASTPPWPTLRTQL